MLRKLFNFKYGLGCLFAVLVLIVPAAAQEGDTIRIRTFEDLVSLSEGKEGFPLFRGIYTLENDIDASASRTMNDGKGFSPIGGTGHFRGLFNGKGHTISNLYINRPEQDRIGLFRSVDSGTVSGIRLVDVSITGKFEVGSLIGFFNGGEIIDCFVSGTVSGESEVGGLVGWAWNHWPLFMSKCVFYGTVSGGGQVGGLAGRLTGEITESHFSGIVRGRGAGVGGLIGFIHRDISKVTMCYASGEVSSLNSAIGGLVGSNEGVITRSYSTAAVISNAFMQGGLVGSNSGSIIECYAVGTMIVRSNSGTRVGGLVGENGNNGTITRSLWDATTTGQTNSAGGGKGLTTAQMMDFGTFLDEDWDFGIGDAGTWGISDGKSYPYFKSLPVYTYTYTAGENGTIQGALTQIANPSAARIVTAVPNEGFAFASWSDGVAVAQRIDNNVKGDITVTANFAAPIVIRYVASEGGTVSGDTVQTIGIGGITTAVEAIPNIGYYFESWSDGLKTAKRFDEDITSGETYTAKFARVKHIISDLEDLLKIGGSNEYPMNAIYELEKDINISNCRTLDEGRGFTPIGSSGKPFTGIFDGKGFTISGLYINRPTSDSVGLFGFTNGAVIAGVSVVADSIIGKNFTGGIAGSFNGGTIGGSSFEGAVKGQNNVGGLVGSANGTIDQSYSAGFVDGSYRVGGLVGRNDGTIRDSYSTSAVTGAMGHIGGLAGYTNGSIINCYAASEVETETGVVGGLLGFAEAPITITKALNNIGVVNSFWDTDVSGLNTSAGGSGKSSDLMKQAATYTGWNFTDVWTIDEGSDYPRLLAFTSGYTSVKGKTITRAPTAQRPLIAVRGRVLRVNADTNTELNIRIIDLRGKTLARFKSNGSENISLTKIPAGRYIAETKVNGKRVTTAFVLR